MRGRPYLTAALLLLCWAASLAFWAGEPLVTGAGYAWQAISPGQLFGTRFWLYVSWSVLLHSGWAHLLLNSLALIICGGGLERLWGSRAFGALILLSGVLGSTAQAAWWGHGDIGASGVVYACAGALLAIRVRDALTLPKHLRIAVVILVAWLILGVVRGALGAAGIGNISHLVGFGVGAAYALIKGRRGPFDLQPRELAAEHVGQTSNDENTLCRPTLQS